MAPHLTEQLDKALDSSHANESKDGKSCVMGCLDMVVFCLGQRGFGREPFKLVPTPLLYLSSSYPQSFLCLSNRRRLGQHTLACLLVEEIGFADFRLHLVEKLS